MLDVCLLGCGGTQPLPGRRLSSVLVRYQGRLLLLDCGEGTQVALRERAWGLRNLDAILLTHLHGDHVLGLPGLLLTLAFTGKAQDERLLICGPEPLIDVVSSLLVVAPRLPFPVDLVLLSGDEDFEAPSMPGLHLACCPVQHDAPCLAYALGLDRAPRFNPDRAAALGVPRSAWRTLQNGTAVQVNGRTVEPGAVVGPSRRGLRLVLATDLRPGPAVTSFIRADGRGTDLLIADAMYPTEAEMPKRWDAQHLTFAEAATLARDGMARRLWLTHYGPALADPSAHLHHAQDIFPNTVAGYDGLTTTLTFLDD